MHADCAMAGADSGAAWIGGCAAAGFAGWRFAGHDTRGVVAGDAIFAFGRAAVWGSGGGRGVGARDLVGAAAGVVGQDSRDDGDFAFELQAYCDSSELRGTGLPGARSDTADLARIGFRKALQRGAPLKVLEDPVETKKPGRSGA